MNEIGLKIKEIMEKEDIWNFQIARTTGILKNNICVILGPKGNPKWSTVKRILDAIGYEVVLRKRIGLNKSD